MATARTSTAQRPPSPAETAAFVEVSLSDEGLREHFTDTMNTDEFSIYLPNVDDIYHEFRTQSPALLRNLQKSADNLRIHCSHIENLITNYRVMARRRRAVEALVLVIMAFTALFLVNSFKIANIYWALLALGALIIIVAMLAYEAYLRSRPVSWMLELQQQQDSYRQEWDTQVAELLRRSITEAFRKAGIVHFPIKAPTLVELTTAKIVPSATRQIVTEFIRNHQSSAIGIAGPRGSGKSTLMQGIYESNFASHSVLIPAPVKYEPVEFTRRLFWDIATEILSEAHYPIYRPRRAQEQRILLLRTARTAFTIGIALSATSVIFAAIVKSVWHWYWPSIAAATSLIGLIAVLLAGIVLIIANLQSFGNRVTPSSSYSPSVNLAAQAVDMLVWDIKEATTEKSTVKLFGGLVTLGGEDSMSRSRRELSLPDLVDRFRTLLSAFSAEVEDNRFVVFIDELDKIAKTDELIDVVNGLKDLLHIPGVHFVVSVSMEALRRFEERGVPARDAFDSAFDVIVSARLLTLDESCQILAARVAAFPTILALYCHAWSGGLARDLLRIARNCVDAQRSAENIPHISEIIRSVITTDLRTHIVNALEGYNNYEDMKMSMHLRGLVKDLDNGVKPLQILRTITKEDTPKRILTNIVTVGTILLACMPIDASDPDWWNEPGPSMRTKIEAIAAARAALSGPVPLQAEAIAKAVQSVSSGLVTAP